MSKASIPWVIKFGGSLAGSEALGKGIRALAPLRVIIVPGGGPFADAIRACQMQLGFGDTLAHQLAIQAMGLYGQMLHGIEPRLKRATTIAHLRDQCERDQALLWLPDPDESCLSSLEASWHVTSDTLAVHLALTLGVPQVLLMKSLDSDPGDESLQDASDQGIVDRALPEKVRGSGIKLWRTGPQGFEGLAKGLENPVSWFTRMVY